MAQPNLTYYINQNTKRINSMVDGLESIKQTVYKTMETEKFYYMIYSWFYGVELSSFVGLDYDYIQAELRSRITACLQADDRILSITNFKCVQTDIDSMIIYFECVTEEGDFPVEKEV